MLEKFTHGDWKHTLGRWDIIRTHGFLNPEEYPIWRKVSAEFMLDHIILSSFIMAIQKNK